MRNPSKRVLFIFSFLYLGVCSYIFYLLLRFLDPSTTEPRNVFLGLFLYPVCAIFAFFFILLSYMTGWRLTVYGLIRQPEAKDGPIEDSLEKSSILRKQSIDTIICYSCRDVFIEKENVCDKCGAPKPNCIVCGLDLSPETDPSEKVIILPCCSVYVHTEHILEWLEIKELCPNCKQKITKEDLLSI